MLGDVCHHPGIRLVFPMDPRRILRIAEDDEVGSCYLK